MDPVTPPAADAPKPITTDPDEVELLQSMNIPLTDPDAKPRDVDETHTPESEAADVEGSDGADESSVGRDGGVGGGATPADAAVGGSAADDADEGGESDAVAGAGGAKGTAAGDGGPDGDDAVREDPATPAPVAPTAVTAQTPPPSDAAKRLAEVEALIEADSYDPYSAEGKKLLIEHNRLAAKVEAEPLYAEKRQAEAWAPYLQQFPGIDQKQMQQVLQKHSDTYGKRGMTGDALQAAATVAMEIELQQISNGRKGGQTAAAAKGVAKGAKVAAPVAKTPITPKGAIVAPPAATPVRAPAAALSDEDELVQTNRKMHPGGMRRALRG